MKTVVYLFFLMNLIVFQSAIAAEKGEGSGVFSVAANFYGAEPYPSMVGIMAQIDFAKQFRFSAGYGFTRQNDSIATTVGIAGKAFPYSLTLKNDIRLRTVIGLSFARFVSANPGSVYNVSGDGIVTSADVGAELNTNTQVDVGMGIMTPLSHSGSITPYARIVFRPF